jgi:hypothetical protein
MKSQKLSDLMFGKPSNAKRIKDYARIDYIFRLYHIKHFDRMSREIYFYKFMDFYSDMIWYLEDQFKSKSVKSFLYMDIIDEYLDREEEIKEEMNLRSERKKYGL